MKPSRGAQGAGAGRARGPGEGGYLFVSSGIVSFLAAANFGETPCNTLLALINPLATARGMRMRKFARVEWAASGPARRGRGGVGDSTVPPEF